MYIATYVTVGVACMCYYTSLSAIIMDNYINCGESWVLRHSCTYTHTSGDHAQIQNYDDGIHFECTTIAVLPVYTLYEMSLTWDFSVVGLVNF